MILHERILPKDHRIVLISDVHIGTKAHHRKGFIQAVELAKEPNTYLCFMGDHIEGIAIDDPRYDPANLDNKAGTIALQYNDFIDIVEPYANKTLVVMRGNHELKPENRMGDFTKDLVCARISSKTNKDSNWLYGDYACKMAITDRKGNLQYKMYLHHGFGSINSSIDDEAKRKAAMQGTLKRKLQPMAADCAIMAMGHTHQLIVRPPQEKLYLTDNGKDIKDNYLKLNQTVDYIDPESRYYVNTGCFYKTSIIGSASYAERAGYSPNVLGFPVIHVKNGIIQEIEKVLL